MKTQTKVIIGIAGVILIVGTAGLIYYQNKNKPPVMATTTTQTQNQIQHGGIVSAVFNGLHLSIA